MPGYPASHGCIRLPFSFAPKLFQITTVGEHVIVSRDKVAPKFVEHPILFQRISPPETTTEDVVLNADSKPFNEAVAITADGPHRRDAATEIPSPVEPVSPSATAPSATEPKGTAMHAISGANAEPSTHAIDLLASDSGKPSSDGTDNHAVVDARSLPPLRVLVTRRTQRDRIIAVQYLLSSMGYLAPQKFSGRLGEATVTAIKAFEKANGLRESGTFTDNLVKKVYAVAGQQELEGHLFVRQGFRPVFDVPIAFRNADETLGTHVFTAMFRPGDTNIQWMSLTLEGDDATRVLDRIQIPNDVRQKIAEKLTPGSSLIVGDKSVNSAILPDGADFLVLGRDTPVLAEKPSTKQAHATRARGKHARVARKGREEKWEHAAPRYSYDYPRRYRRQRLFFRW